MDAVELKKKIMEWLKLKEEVESLSKADPRGIMGMATSMKRKADQMKPSNVGVHEQHSSAPQGQSVAGHDYQVGAKIKAKGGKDLFGFMRHALDSHKAKLDQAKAMPKPNLPKSEDMQKAKVDQKLGEAMRGASGHTHGIEDAKIKARKGRQSLSNEGVHPSYGKKSGTSVAHEDYRQGVADRKETRVAHERVLSELKQMPKPNLPKSEPAIKPAIIARPDKGYGAIIDRTPKPMKKAAIIPNMISEPVLHNSRTTRTSPKRINEPNIVNSYKSENSEVTGRLMTLNDIISHLKNKGK